MRVLGFVALASVTAACTITEEGIEEVEIKTEEIFPPSKTIASFRMLEKPKRMDGDALAEQLGGKSRHDMLKKWSTTVTLYADYGVPKQPPAVRVSVTEMGSKVSAYGAYTNLRPGLLPEKQYVKIGAHGTIDGARLIFIHDRYVISVVALQKFTDEQLRSLLVNFGRGITARIPRPISDIDPVTFLPLENRVPASERLDKEDPLGLGVFESGAITAIYRVEGREGKIFIGQTADALTHRGYYNKLIKALEKNGKTKEVSIGDTAAMGKLFGATCIVCQREKAVFGVYGTLTEDEMREMLLSIDRKVKPYVPPSMKDIKKKEEEREREREAESKKGQGQ
ncbi:MAG: hypothetical protein KIS92_19435 [Planctomycetota bacterium]|nr:hypothetical protein [Planctomycetota bacterium]